MKLQVTYDDGEPTMIVARVGELTEQPVFYMEGSTAVLAGPAISENLEEAADAVYDELPFVQAVEVNP